MSPETLRRRSLDVRPFPDRSGNHRTGRRETGRSGISLVTDSAELRAAVSLISGRDSPVRCVPVSQLPRAWADAELVALGLDSLTLARTMVTARNRPDRVAVIADGFQNTGDSAWLPGVPLFTLPEARDDVGRWLAADEALAPVVAIVGGRGGAGATTAAVAVARAAARRAGSSVLLDVDPLGGGVDLALGAESVAGPRWPDLAELTAAITPRWLLSAMPTVDGVSFVSHARRGGAARPGSGSAVDDAVVATVVDTCAAAVPVVVLDLARPGSTAALVALSRCTTLVVVVPAEVRACAAAAAVLAEYGAGTADVRVLVRGPSPGGLAGEDVAHAVGVSAFDEVRSELGISAALERGLPVAVSTRSPLRRWATTFVDSLPELRG